MAARARAAIARAAIHQRNEARRNGADPPGSSEFKKQFLSQLLPTIAALEATRPVAKTTRGDAFALVKRLENLYEDLWHFLDDLQIPATNNGSGQALRTWKVRQRRSGTFRSPTSARQWLRIGSYLDTTRKRGYTPEQAFDALFAGAPIMASAPALVAP